MKFKTLISIACMSFGLASAQGVKPSDPNLFHDAESIIEKGTRVFITEQHLNNLSAKRPVDLLDMLTTPYKGDIDQLEVLKRNTDDLGRSIVKIQQTVNGLPIVGSVMVVRSNAQGDLTGINGMFAKTDGLATEPTVRPRRAIMSAMRLANIQNGKLASSPELTYIMNENGVAFLAWAFDVTYTNAEGDQRDRLFADATGAERFVRHPQHHSAKNRRTYDANNSSSLPGSLVRTEGQGNVSDNEVNNAHNYAGVTYDYYKARFGRDSYDGRGATMTSSVHYQSNLNNAYWNGSQMIYGDGDGSTFAPLCNSLDVVAHELTHAVTSAESNLVYQNESGALNEALSDIFGVAAGVYATGRIDSNTWLLGEDVYTPGRSGDALRYMNNPTRDGSSKDYYPERYTGSSDNGGVHINSGIANLAFYLMVQGGTHPRGKTSVNVPAIGMSKAEKIWYRAQTNYLTRYSNFEDARNATASAAADLYGSSEVAAVHAAWDAVGVPGGDTGNGSCQGDTYNGYLSGSNAEEFQPNGTYYYAGSGSHVGELSGAGSDFDLYLWKWNGSWSTVASSTSSNSEESISYNGTSGYYVFRVHSYSGSGSYSICIDHP